MPIIIRLLLDFIGTKMSKLPQIPDDVWSQYCRAFYARNSMRCVRDRFEWTGCSLQRHVLLAFWKILNGEELWGFRIEELLVLYIVQNEAFDVLSTIIIDDEFEEKFNILMDEIESRLAVVFICMDSVKSPTNRLFGARRKK